MKRNEEYSPGETVSGSLFLEKLELGTTYKLDRTSGSQWVGAFHGDHVGRQAWRVFQVQDGREYFLNLDEYTKFDWRDYYETE